MFEFSLLDLMALTGIQCSVAVLMAQNRNRSNGIFRAAYACSLAMCCGSVFGIWSVERNAL